MRHKADQSMTIAEGMFGVKQLYIVD